MASPRPGKDGRYERSLICRIGDVAPSHQPGARPAFRGKPVGDVLLRNPIAWPWLKAGVGPVRIVRIAAAAILVGCPAMIELVDHLGFIERNMGCGSAAGRNPSTPVADKAGPGEL